MAVFNAIKKVNMTKKIDEPAPPEDSIVITENNDSSHLATEKPPGFSKDWCTGFCRTCGTGCAQYCEEVFKLKAENARLREALELIATPIRPDGSWNRDRKACQELAKVALESNSKV